ncbi:MAG: ABC transporter ATP-binding protein [archaeon]|nr:ABC transporter ATP-binding protein [archaeon]
MLSVSNLTQGYDDKVVLDSVSLDVNKGEMVCVLGPNGSGKSTLIKTVCNILKPMGGDVTVNGRSVSDYDPKEFSKLVGYVPQNYSTSDYMKVFDAVLLGRAPYMSWSYSKDDFRMAAKSIYDMGIFDLIDRNVNDLSGGQMQKVTLARAMTQNPEFYVLDEPTSALDLRNQIDTLTAIRKAVKESNAGALVALHDLNLAIQFCDRVVLIKDGKVFRDGAPLDVIDEESIFQVYGVYSEIMEGREGKFVHICERPPQN